VIYTIGHSTRTAAAFVELLRIHQVGGVADVRTIPRSRRHPHFEREALSRILTAEGIEYRHIPELGGLRKPRPDSANTAWRHPSFRGYADYMGSEAFADGIERLLEFARERPTAIMCAEAVWWQCHRRLLADALVVRGIPVSHILSGSPPEPHALSEFARVQGGSLTYPGLL
jgi:uncharacterized protein (DUF488 family)